MPSPRCKHCDQPLVEIDSTLCLTHSLSDMLYLPHLGGIHHAISTHTTDADYVAHLCRAGHCRRFVSCTL